MEDDFCVSVLIVEDTRSEKVFAGMNHLHFGEGRVNYVVLPVIPPK